MLELKNATLKRGPQLLFENASFTIYPAKRVGVTGANGAGKSSLFSLIQGGLELDTGDFTLPSKLVIAHVEQEIRNQDWSAIDYVIEGDKALSDTLQKLSIAEASHNAEDIAQLHHKMEEIQGYAGNSKAAKLLNGLGFTQEQFSNTVSSFSGGWQMRLNLARALMCRSDILLLDEPTNHLDLDTVLWLEDYLKTYPGTLLLISHDRDFLDSVINQILHISNRKASIYNGNYSSYENYRSEQLALQQAGYAKQQKHIQHVQSFINRFKAQATKAKQAQSRIKALEKLELIAPAHIDSPFTFSFKAPENNPHTLLRLDDVTVAYDKDPILEKINFSMFAGDRIGLLGSNGAGKSTLVKLLSNELKPKEGKIELNTNLNIGYFAQHQLSQLNLQNSALQCMMLLAKDISVKATEQELRNYLGGFNFHDDKVSQTIETFSGGEKARLVLAMIVYQKPNLLLLDEPTNHLDIDMRDALTFALQDFEGALAIVSHDRHLLRTVCDSFVLVHDKAVTEFNGDLEDYRQFIKQANEETSNTKESNGGISKKEQRRIDAEQRKQLQPLKNKLAKIEREMATLNDTKSTLETRLADGDIYHESNKEQLTKTLKAQAETSTKLDTLEEEWIEIMEKLE